MTQMIKHLARGLLPLTLLLAAGQAAAHQLWIEPVEGGAAMHFGYLDRNLREISPGRLDSIVQPKAERVHTNGQAETLALQPKQDQLFMPLEQSLESGESLVLNFANGPVYERDGVGTHWTLAARYAADPLEKADKRLEFDLVPTGKLGEFQVTLHGEPVTNHTVRLATEFGWRMERNTNHEGLVSFPALPWQGLYVVAANHTVDEEGKGERALADGSTEAINYHRRGFITTLTFDLKEGLPKVPRLPKSPPYESGTRTQ